MRIEDAHIIHSCLNGDSSSFSLLVEKYKSKVHALAYNKLKNFHDAEDVTQEVFIKAYQNLRNLRQWDSLPAWLYSITSNQCSKWTRKQAINKSYHEKLKEHLSTSYPDENESLLEVLNSLPETDRQVLTLYYLSGMDSNDIAEFLAISPSAVRQRLSRARTQLKEEMIDVMRATFEQNRLPASFTFRIMEMVKHLRIHPIPRTTTLPWGISTAAGIAFLIFSFGFHLSFTSPINDMIKSNLSLDNAGETKLSTTGEFLFPLDIFKVSELSRIAKDQGDGAGSGANNAFFFAPKAEGGEWTAKASMAFQRAYTSGCVVNGKIYVFGGHDSALVTHAKVEEYDPATNTWTEKKDMPEEGRGLCTNVVNGKIYITGGYGLAGDAISSTMEYDPVNDTYIKKADMPTARAFHSTSVVNKKIYAFGGLDANSQGISSAEEYDPEKDEWTKKTNMPLARFGFVMGAIDGKIYALIGNTGGAVNWAPALGIDIYDPVADKWDRKALNANDIKGIGGISVNDIGTYNSSCVINNKIYITGGGGIIGLLSVLVVYDPIDNIWEKKSNMINIRMGHSTVALNGKLYSMGGFNGAALSSVEEYTLEDWQFSVVSQGKLSTTWGQQKSKE